MPETMSTYKKMCSRLSSFFKRLECRTDFYVNFAVFVNLYALDEAKNSSMIEAGKNVVDDRVIIIYYYDFCCC